MHVKVCVFAVNQIMQAGYDCEPVFDYVIIASQYEASYNRALIDLAVISNKAI